MFRFDSFWSIKTLPEYTVSQFGHFLLEIRFLIFGRSSVLHLYTLGFLQKMTATTFYFVCCFLLAAFRTNAQDACFWPTGEQDYLDSWACNKSAYGNGDGSACCLAGDTCMGNGVCYQGWSGVMYRQTCTDREWKSSSCPQVASTGLFNISQGVWILQCDVSSKSWCAIGPNVKGPCCDNDTKGVTWSDWVPGYTTGLLSNYEGSIGENLVDIPGSTTTGATSSSASSSTASSSRTLAASSSAETSSITTPLPTTQALHKHSSSLRVGLGIGIGVGVPICLLAAILLFWTRKERVKRLLAEKRLQQMSATSSDTSGTSPSQEAKLHPLDLNPSEGHPHEVSDDYRTNELWAGPTVNELGGDNKYANRVS